MAVRRRGGGKPRDVGTGVLCASIGGSGAWLSLASIHAEHGFIELTGLPPFDEARRGDPAAVRAYRALMADERSAFLVLAPAGGTRLDRRLVAPIAGARSIGQRLYLRRQPGSSGRLGLRLRFAGRLDTPALAMITEVAAIRPRRLGETGLQLSGSRLRVRAAQPPAEMIIDVTAGGAAVGSWRAAGAGEAVMTLEWPDSDDQARVSVTCGLAAVEAADAPSGPGRRRRVRRTGPPSGTGLWAPAAMAGELQAIRRRALRYVRQCTGLRPAAGRLAILTDHRLLPLSWTRDAYWQALLLLRAGELEPVADHLRWLWLDCARPAATWSRSHHADGRRSDEVYQVDQQLYPLLELADYRSVAGHLPRLGAGQRWPALVSEVVADMGRRMDQRGLVATDENPADDRADLPYLVSSQILAWHALARTASVPEFATLEPAPGLLAERAKVAVARHFVVQGPAGASWAYAIDGRGAARLYQDANDVPTALAPLWGFCGAHDPTWRHTMDHALSASNEAYAAGSFGGLGSAHTPGVWSLGLIQEWVARGLVGDHAAAADALRRLVACALSDWSLPEASDPGSGRLGARHWFAWPGAMVGCLIDEPPVA